MSNLKAKVSLLVVIMLIVSAFSVAFAVNYIMNLSVSYNGKALADKEQVELLNSATNRTLTVTTDAKYVDSSLTIYVTRSGQSRQVLSTGKKSATFTIPSDLKEGYITDFAFEAVSNNTTNNYIGNSNGFHVFVYCPKEEEVTVTANLSYNGKTMAHGSSFEANAGDKLTISGTSNIGVKLVSYKWDDGEVKSVNGSSTTITVPNLGTGKKLSIVAQATDGKWSNSKTFTVLPKATSTATTIAANLKVDGVAKDHQSTITVNDKTKLVVEGTSNKSVSIVSYKWSNGNVVEKSGSSYTIPVPSSIPAAGLTLSISAKASDGTWSASKSFTIKKAATGEDPVTTTINPKLTADGKTITEGSTVTVSGSTKLVVTATTNKSVKLVSYKWANGNVVEVNATSATIPVPSLPAEGLQLGISAQASDDTWSAAKYFIVKPASDTPVQTTINANLKVNGDTVAEGTTIKADSSTKLQVVGTSNKSVKLVSYKWSNANIVEVTGSSANIPVPTLPAAGLQLGISAQASDGTWSAAKYFTVKPASSTTPDETTIEAILKVDSKTIAEGATIKANSDTKMVVTATTNKSVKIVSYKWGNNATVEVNATSATIPVPTIPEAGIKLGISAQASDGTWSAAKYFTVKPASESSSSDDELIVEPWMRENDDLDRLAVSLRSEPFEAEDRANLNIYALNEKVVYYVDYKNGGKDINKEVKLTLDLPLAFTVVDAHGGTVDKKEGTITWTFANGLAKDQAGTKVVVIKYTSLGNSKATYKRITPDATIFQDGKKKDISSVINLIVKDFDTEIKDEHDPYMYGDLGTDTFRPDDTITRAEGALVLTRIFGISTAYDNNEYDFPDLNETYISARRAIRAARAYGLIEGFPDGNYYPNKEMTRGEFMTIIARQLEEDEGEGFEVKEEDELIKVYKDKNRIYYISDKEQYDAHWAAGYATLLCRLNMTPVSEKNLNLRLDEPISRAEVAQLVNYYLLRAPAYVTKSTKIQFSDVSKKHPLFADIVEATRDSHTWSLNEDGEEVKE